MSDKIDYLRYKLQIWEEMKNKHIDFNWKIPEDLICLFADMLMEIAKSLPTDLEWLKTMLKLVAELLKSLCLSLANDMSKNIQYANTRG